MIKIYGKNCIHEAIRANSPIKQVFLLESNQKKDQAFLNLLEDKKIEYTILSKIEMDKIFGFGHQGYGAYREEYMIYDEKDLENLCKNATRVLLLDGIMDPQNLGAILRTVDAFGVDFVILPKNRSCFITEAVAHVSTGAIEHVKVAVVNSLLSTVKKLKEIGFWICGTAANGKDKIKNIDLSLQLGIIIGSEGFGMSKTLVKESDFLLRIPMVGHVNSLNASVSCAIILHDLMVQE